MTDDQEIYMPMPGAVPQIQKSDRAELIDKIKPDVIIEIIRQRLLGRQEIDGVWREVPALKSRALTEVGAWEISNLMLGTASINVSISKLNDHEIKIRAFRIAKTAQYLCIANWKGYGIKNSSQLHFVNEIIFTNSLVVLKQADEASIQELLKGTVTENRNINTEVPRQGALGKIRRVIGL